MYENYKNCRSYVCCLNGWLSELLTQFQWKVSCSPWKYSIILQSRVNLLQRVHTEGTGVWGAVWHPAPPPPPATSPGWATYWYACCCMVASVCGPGHFAGGRFSGFGKWDEFLSIAPGGRGIVGHIPDTTGPAVWGEVSSCLIRFPSSELRTWTREKECLGKQEVYLYLYLYLSNYICLSNLI